MARQTKSKGKTALKKTGRALKGFAQGALSAGAQILGAGAEVLNPGRKHLPKATAKEQRQYEHILESELKKGRAKSTAKRIAAATVRKRQSSKKRNKTIIKAGRIDHLDVSKVHNPKKRKRAQTKNPKRGSYREPPFTGSFGSVPINRKFRIKKGEEDLVSLADIGPIFTNTNIRGQAKDKDGYIRHFPLWTAVELVNPSRRRNADRKDSDHPIEVTKHWRAGPPGYLTPWQRAHHAGQSQLFETGIKPAKRRNASKEEHDFYNKMLAILSRDPHDSHAKGAAQMAGKRLGFTPARIAKDIERAKGAKRNAARTISAKPSKTRRARASSQTGHKKTATKVRSVAKARKASTRRASNKTLKKSSRVGKRRNASSKVITKRITTYRTRPIGQYLFSGGMEYFYDGHDGRMAGYKTLAETKAAIDKEAQWWADYYKSRGVKIKPPRNAPRRGRKNPSAESIRKTFAGSVNGERDLFFPQGTPSGKLAKLGKLVSITTEAGTIKPVHGTAWLCADTRGKLHIGATSNAPLYSGPARNFGHVTKLEYESSKPHLGYGPTIWFHKAGEENGIRPTLRADGKGGLVFRGGAYRLTERGIEN